MIQKKEHPVLLMIDTATPVCSLAIAHGEELIACHTEQDRRGEHAAVAAPIAEQLIRQLEERGLSPDAVVVSAGPGSYTGLRIGSSLAKGLCQGYGIPLIAISTLEMMAQGYLANMPHPTDAVRLCPMIDARRMEVYTATFDAKGGRLSEDRPYVLSADALLDDEMRSHRYHFFGSGAGKCSGLWEGVDYVVAEDFIPEARYMHQLALEAYERGEFADLAYWTPNYLKEYVAVVAQNKVLGR
ncbi:MAG: tRNA (adenosine(37)-N6)-threonylcarbamoyltransferase complex dimerization subunit type 1 TsaB [Porphyromonadaceae bacterium]|nr:tRNA (adenosine(37)-N6)-threonylcarbamoyltransferase complex dimerization subunit type 1 TsaB [Porphyromonadaceae bacterium]